LATCLNKPFGDPISNFSTGWQIQSGLVEIDVKIKGKSGDL